MIESDRSKPSARRIHDPEEVRKYVHVRPGYKDKEEEIIKAIADAGALIEGCFILSEDEID